jgi:glycosyltransferase involved in cell wall biosynthesis
MGVKFSIITVCFNSQATIADTLRTVAAQRYSDVEHIIVDGASSDGTLDVVKRSAYPVQLISERDRGIYDAMNKGIARANGDVIGILNADDFYPHAHVLERVAREFEIPGVEATIGDICFVSPGDLTRKVRYYSAQRWAPRRFVRGFMPPHPAFFTWKRNYEHLGNYKLGYKIASDYELLVRFLAVHQLHYRYIPDALVHMRAGGVSNESLKSRYILNREIVRACAENGLKTNLVLLSLKYLEKMFEYLPHRLK